MFRWLVVVLVACAGSSPAPAPPPSPKLPVGDHGVDVANLNAQLPPYLASVGGGAPLRALSGYVLVAQHDQVLYGHGFGLADRARQRPPTADTSFRVGSVTKQFTAAAILSLEQDGKLAVEDKVSKHLPDYPGPAKDVTIHQLLTHTAGSVLSIAITGTAGGIELKAVGQRAFELVPGDDGSFYNADLDVRIRVHVPPSGPVKSVTLEQRKLEITYQR